jgi:hypothetical protein
MENPRSEAEEIFITCELSVYGHTHNIMNSFCKKYAKFIETIGDRELHY